jgi:hypothetical protein
MVAEFQARIVDAGESSAAQHEASTVRNPAKKPPSKPERAPREALPLSSIERDPAINCRAGGVNEKLVIEYTEAMKGDAPFPPVAVFRDADGVNWLADGFHRCAAAERVGGGEGKVLTEIRQGDRRAALLFAASANAAHGARRSNADKRQAVTMLLADPEWATKSDAWIAEKCAVSDRFVARYRPTPNDSELLEREGKDGKKRRAPKHSKRARGKAKTNPEKAAAALTRKFEKEGRQFVKSWPRELLLDTARKWMESLQAAAS